MFRGKSERERERQKEIERKKKEGINLTGKWKIVFLIRVWWVMTGCNVLAVTLMQWLLKLEAWVVTVFFI